MPLPDNGQVLLNWRELGVAIETRNLGLDPPMLAVPHTFKVRGDYLATVVVRDQNGAPWSFVGLHFWLAQNRAVYLTLWNRDIGGHVGVNAAAAGRAITLTLV
jgi:hypothetical protein